MGNSGKKGTTRQCCHLIASNCFLSIFFLLPYALVVNVISLAGRTQEALGGLFAGLIDHTWKKWKIFRIGCIDSATVSCSVPSTHIFFSLHFFFLPLLPMIDICMRVGNKNIIIKQRLLKQNRLLSHVQVFKRSSAKLIYAFYGLSNRPLDINVVRMSQHLGASEKHHFLQ